MLAPAGTRNEIVERLNRELVRIVQMQETRSRFLALGTEPFTLAPAQFGRFIEAEIAKWAKVVKDANVKAN